MIIGVLCFVGGFFLGVLATGLLVASAAGDRRNWSGE